VRDGSSYFGDRSGKYVRSSLDLTCTFFHSEFFHCTVFSYLWIIHDYPDWPNVCYLFCPFHSCLVDHAKTFGTLGNGMEIKPPQT